MHDRADNVYRRLQASRAHSTRLWLGAWLHLRLSLIRTILYVHACTVCAWVSLAFEPCAQPVTPWLTMSATGRVTVLQRALRMTTRLLGEMKADVCYEHGCDLKAPNAPGPGALLGLNHRTKHAKFSTRWKHAQQVDIRPTCHELTRVQTWAHHAKQITQSVLAPLTGADHARMLRNSSGISSLKADLVLQVSVPCACGSPVPPVRPR
jgi:hypothetical protein